MYLSFFGLNEKPFAITPDPRYLFLSERHAEALAHLVYGINEAGGFVQLTGEVGTGKTTIIRSLLAQAPRNAEVALILNPRITAPEFLLTICEELGIGVPDSAVGSVKELVDILNRYLLRAHSEGRRVVLVVDEAQNLAPEVLEQVRLLTNLETETQKLLQIILIGQPELRELLGRTELRQLAQRVTGRYHLAPLSADETAAYVRHRLRVAGSTSDILTPSALAEIHRLSQGVPRVINVVADRALLGAYTQDRHRVSPALVRRAASEVFGRQFAPRWIPWLLGGLGVVALLGTGLLIWRFLPREPSTAAPSTVAAATAGSQRRDAARAATGTTAGAGNARADVTATVPVWLSSLGARGSTNAAFGTLFSLWQQAYEPGNGDPCVQAQRVGLSCLAQRGSLAQLELYNRPALLTLTDSQGVDHDVVLVSFRDDRAVLSAGGLTRDVAIAELTRYWFGDFVILWQPGGTGARTLAFGARGSSVMQLSSKLKRLAGRAAAAPQTRYDADVMQLVEDFQRRSRLNVDGVAGVQTLVALDSALPAPGTPTLMPSGPR